MKQQTSQDMNWTFECDVKHPLPTVNLFRKLFMSELGCYKLTVATYECDDPFLIREFIEQRIRQIPIQQSERIKSAVFTLNVSNDHVAQEICVTTDHIRCVVDGKDVSARRALHLCDQYLICKLGQKCSINLKMETQHGKPRDSDLFRCGLCIVTQLGGSSSNALELRHDRAESRCKITSFGVLSKESFRTGRVIYNEMRDIVATLSSDIQATFSNQFIHIGFGRIPHLFVDPVMCLILQELKQFGNQVQISQQNNAILIGATRVIQQEDLDSLQTLALQAMQTLLQNVDALEKDICSQMNA